MKEFDSIRVVDKGESISFEMTRRRCRGSVYGNHVSVPGNCWSDRGHD